jgi:hypothetical protein
MALSTWPRRLRLFRVSPRARNASKLRPSPGAVRAAGQTASSVGHNRVWLARYAHLAGRRSDANPGRRSRHSSGTRARRQHGRCTPSKTRSPSATSSPPNGWPSRSGPARRAVPSPLPPPPPRLSSTSGTRPLDPLRRIGASRVSLPPHLRTPKSRARRGPPGAVLDTARAGRAPSRSSGSGLPSSASPLGKRPRRGGFAQKMPRPRVRA